MRRKAIGVIAALAALLAAGWWLLEAGVLLPAWISWEEREILCGASPEKVVLEDRTVTVWDGGSAAWQSGRDIQVQDVLWGDIDHDGEAELMLLCWKRGRYGKSRPFWVTEDEKTWSQHIYLYDWKDGAVSPIWMASDIGMEAVEWSFDETDRLVITDREGRKTAWDWLSWGLTKLEPQTLTFAAVGDNLIHRQIYDYAFRHLDGSFDDLFVRVQEELSRYDVTSINQETIFVERPEQYSDYPFFGTPIQVGHAVVKAGFDIVTCATNHALDQGVEAIGLTAEFYERSGVTCIGIQPLSDGAYRPYELLERNGIRCAVFSYTQSTNGLPLPEDATYVLHTLDDEQQVRTDLLAGREAADLCLVYVHWGTEYTDMPDETQKDWAQVFADCGADVVIGTHPHVVQPVEWVTGTAGNETLVYYSLGNFISAQTDEACRRGGLAYFTVTKEAGDCEITEYGLKTLITEQENGHYTTKLENGE